MKHSAFLSIAIFFSMATLFIRCSKEESPQENSNDLLELLTRQKGWGVISQFIDPPVFIRGVEISDFTKLFEPCEFNSTIRFVLDKEADRATMVEFYEKDSCDPFEPAYIIALLSLRLDQEPPGFIAVDQESGETSFWEILRLDKDRLIIKATNGEKTFTDEFGAKY